MAGFLTDAEMKALADSFLGNGTPATVYAGLSTTTPASDGTGVTEPSGFAYARVAITNNATNFPAASGSGGSITKSNGTAIAWPQASGGSWGTPTYVPLYSVATGGTPFALAQITTAKAVADGDTLSIPASSLVWTFSAT